MPTLAVGDTAIEYTLRRSRRAARARITVMPGTVEVVVPSSATDEQIAEVLQRRRAWLLKQTQRMAGKVASAPIVGSFTSGAKILYRGRLSKLVIAPIDDSLVNVTFRNGLRIGLPRATDPRSADALIEMALRLWLKKQLRQDAAALVVRHGGPNGLIPRGVRIKDQKHLWEVAGRTALST
jgi:predicted metal-dependent hydrolase